MIDPPPPPPPLPFSKFTRVVTSGKRSIVINLPKVNIEQNHLENFDFRPTFTSWRHGRDRMVQHHVIFCQ